MFDIEYLYTHNNVPYSGTTISSYPFSSPKEETKHYNSLIDSYHNNQPITIHLNPQKPTQAAIFTQPSTSIYLYPILTLIAFIATLTSGLLYKHQHEQATRHQPAA